MGELKFVNIFKMRIAVLGFLALLIFGMILGTNPVEAQPFAYVANTDSDNVSVIDTATNMVVGPPIPVGTDPVGVAITPILTSIPTLSEWGLIAMAAILGIVGFVVMRRRKATA
ncbi:MAG: IPTL-CTERM sorting domain-containing protein [Candidatus Dadabacteria bacterium]|nr:IPTL-CTERM sorting domain-containing protein [Candidatus Dadabacteria bacterium]